MKHLMDPGSFRWETLTICIGYLADRASIGGNSTAAVQAACGELIVHWGDDDISPGGCISLQLGLFISTEAQLTAPVQDIVEHFPDLTFFKSPESSLVLGALACQWQVA